MASAYTYNYSKLRGRITEIFDTQKNFCEAMGMTQTTLSKKMNCIVYFTQPEISKALNLLHLESADVKDYFFA